MNVGVGIDRAPRPPYFGSREVSAESIRLLSEMRACEESSPQEPPLNPAPSAVLESGQKDISCLPSELSEPSPFVCPK